MKKNLLVFITVLLTVSGYAQKTADIGIWGGASTYWGDMTQVDYSKSIKPLFGAFFRYNFNERVGVRTSYLTGNMYATGYMANEPWSFGPKRIHDFSVMVEINYLKYVLGYKKTPFTPYVLGGFGFMYFPYNLYPDKIYLFNPRNNKGIFEKHVSLIAPDLPFGMGIKTHIGKRFGIGVEFMIRKLFNDKLDDLDDPLAYINQEGKVVRYTDFIHNNDYTAYLGVHLTYKIYMGKQICPVYESKN